MPTSLTITSLLDGFCDLSDIESIIFFEREFLNSASGAGNFYSFLPLGAAFFLANNLINLIHMNDIRSC